MLNKKLLEILACPKCKGDIEFKEKESLIVCKKCKIAFPVREDIPIMLIEESKPYDK